MTSSQRASPTKGSGGGGGKERKGNPSQPTMLSHLERRGVLKIVTVVAVLVSLHLLTHRGGDNTRRAASGLHDRGADGTADESGSPSLSGSGSISERGHRRDGHGGTTSIAYELLELELAARVRGERPSPHLGMEGLNDRSNAKRVKATACYKGSECDSGLCVDGRCVCPLLYSGSGCVNITAMPTKERSNRTAAGGAWCGVAFDHPAFFPAKPAERRGPAPLRTFLAQAMKGRAPDLPSMADFSTCAVVGSSASLLDRRLGVDIESHTAVFRANDAPTQGYEAHVGRKTTLRVQNIAYCGFRERTTELTVHYTDNHRAHVGTVCTAPHIKRISPRMLSYSKSYWTRAKPPPPEDPTGGKAKLSGGFFGVTLAMHLCGRVDVYGFDQRDDHYYDKVKQVGSPFAARHAWAYERRCLKQLEYSGEKGKLRGRIRVH